MSDLVPKSNDGRLAERVSTKIPVIMSDRDAHKAGSLRIKSGKDRLFAEPESTSHASLSE